MIHVFKVNRSNFAYNQNQKIKQIVDQQFSRHMRHMHDKNISVNNYEMFKLDV